MSLQLFHFSGKKPGSFHLSQHSIPHVDEQRTVRVYLPNRVRDSDPPRPLVLLFDGQNVFDDAPSFAGGWHVHSAVERLARVKRPAPIVVAIDHGHAQRIRELSFMHSHFGAPSLDPFADWIAERLVPAVRAEFSIINHPSGVIIGGSSLGGLAAMYTHLRRPETFGGVLAMSPSFWLGNGAIFSVTERTSMPWTTRVYLDAGKREARGALARDATRMSELLSARGWRPGDQLHLRIDPRGTHSERSWRRRVTGALRYLLPPAQSPAVQSRR
jgi:predicted alpha/beta superfamily hydrolase